MSKIDHSLFSAQGHGADQAFGLCPNCNAQLIIKRGKSGPFIGCSCYPECEFTKPLHEHENTEIKAIEGSSCPLCSHQLVIKKGRYGLFIGCSDFPTCNYIQSSKSAEDTKVNCPSCKNGHMTKRTSKFGKTFYSCSEYPKCKYVLNSQPTFHPCPVCGWEVAVKKKTAAGEILVCAKKLCGYKSSAP